MDFVKIENIPEAKEYDGEIFPITFVPTDSITLSKLLEWLKERGQNGSMRGSEFSLENLMMKHGAILLRGFPINTPQDFAEVVKAIGYENFPYEGGVAPRRNIVDNIVYTTNEAPGHMKIPFHHEMSYASNYPLKIFFYCDKPPKTNGETPILHSNNIYQKIREQFPEYVEKLEENGLLLETLKSPNDIAESSRGRGWKTCYSVSTKEELEAKWSEKKDSTWEWENDNLRESKILTGIREDKRTGKKQFFNNLFGAEEINIPNDPSASLKFGDKSEIPLEFIRKIKKMSEEEQVKFQWKKGDVLLIDNITAMHARECFSGERAILASLAK